MKMWQRVALVLLSAGLGILIFPPFGWSALAVIAWLPLMLALRECKPSHAFYLGLLHGGLFFGVTMSWLVNVFRDAPHLVVPLVLIMSLFTAFFARGYVVAQSRYGPGWMTVLCASCWWTTVEFYRSEIFYLKFPWMTPGLGLGPTWVSSVIGVSGAGFLIILGSAACAQWKKKSQLVAGSVLLVVMLVSAFWQTKKEIPQNTSVRVLAVQNEEGVIDSYTRLTREAGWEYDLIIWPEHALGVDIRKNKYAWKELTDFTREMGCLLVVGTRTELDNGEWYNTALTISPEGVLGEYYKNHPVHFFDDGKPGTEAKPVDTPLGKIGTSICFDNDYQDVVRRMVAGGAEFLAIPSMDGISWGEKEHYQHAEMFRHRAAENGRWIAVAATSGMTQVIDSNGNRVKTIPIIEEGVLSAEIAKNNHLTIYTRIGWLFPWIITITGALWMIWLFVQGIIEERSSRDTRIA